MILLKCLMYTALVFMCFFRAYKEKDSETLYKATMVFCWLVIAMSTDSYDLANYRWAYGEGIVIGKDPLFDLIQKVFMATGLPFEIFKVIYGSLVWCLLYRGMKKFTLDTAMVAALFLLGPAIAHGTQLRSTLAGVIVLNAIPLLTQKKGKTWLYCLIVAVASLIHFMAAFYFVFLLPKFIKATSSKFRNTCCIIALALIPIFLLLAKPVAMWMGWIQTWIGIDVINKVLDRLIPYLNGQMSPNIIGFLFDSCSHFVTFFLTDRMCAAMLQLRREYEGEKRPEFFLSSYAINYLRKLNSILVLFIPCYILSMQFDRFPGYYNVVCYGLIVQGARELRIVRGRTHGSMQEILADVPKWDWHPIRWCTQVLDRYAGEVDLLVMSACIIFCFIVVNWYSGYAGLGQFVNGIGMAFPTD